jgi:hypothetical protein
MLPRYVRRRPPHQPAGGEVSEKEKQAWLDGYCSAAIVAALPVSHPRRNGLLRMFLALLTNPPEKKPKDMHRGMS